MYFKPIDANFLPASDVVQRRLDPPFHPTTSRTLELRYCSTILLPEHLLPPQDGTEAPAQDSGAVAMSQAAQGNPQTEAAYDGVQITSENTLPPHEAT